MIDDDKEVRNNSEYLSPDKTWNRTIILEEKRKIDAELIQQIIQQRNDNFDLKQRIETLTNFRDISQIELRNIRKEYEAACKDKLELTNTVRQQREEILRLKKITEKIENNTGQFESLDFTNNDWLMNKEVYANYINYLKRDNEKKNIKIDELNELVVKLKKQNQDSVVDQYFFNLPKPGEDYDKLDDLAKSSCYMKVYNSLLEFKKEIEIAFDNLEKVNREYNEKIESMKAEHNLAMDKLKKENEVMKKRSEFQNLYHCANKRIKDLETELSCQVGYLEDLLKTKEEEVKKLKEGLADMSKTEMMNREQMISLRKELDISNKKFIDDSKRNAAAAKAGGKENSKDSAGKADPLNTSVVSKVSKTTVGLPPIGKGEKPKEVAKKDEKKEGSVVGVDRKESAKKDVDKDKKVE